jgi:hypothetical protein
VNEITFASGIESYFECGRETPRAMLEITMEIAGRSRFEATQREVRSYDATIMVAYALVTITLLVAIYLDSMSSGTAPGDFASMVVFP